MAINAETPQSEKIAEGNFFSKCRVKWAQSMSEAYGQDFSQSFFS